MVPRQNALNERFMIECGAIVEKVEALWVHFEQVFGLNTRLLKWLLDSNIALRRLSREAVADSPNGFLSFPISRVIVLHSVRLSRVVSQMNDVLPITRVPHNIWYRRCKFRSEIAIRLRWLRTELVI